MQKCIAVRSLLSVLGEMAAGHTGSIGCGPGAGGVYDRRLPAVNFRPASLGKDALGNHIAVPLEVCRSDFVNLHEVPVVRGRLLRRGPTWNVAADGQPE